MSNSYGTFYSTKPTIPSDSPATCPITKHSQGGPHEYQPPVRGRDVRSVCPALNTMANHGYIPRNGRNLGFATIFSGLKACYGLSSPLAFVLALGGFLLIRRLPIQLPFGLEKIVRVRNPDKTTSAPGVLDLHHIGLHNGVEHDASLVHEDAKDGELYPSIRVRDDWVLDLVGDVVPNVEGYSRPPSATSLLSSMAHRFGSEEDSSTLAPSSGEPSQASSNRSSITIPSDIDSGWQKFTSAEHRHTLVSAADVGRMRARRQQEIAPKKVDNFHAEIARGEMAIILGVWEETDAAEKKGIPLPYLLTWLTKERLPEEWEPNHVQGLLDVARRSREIRKVTEAIEKAKS